MKNILILGKTGMLGSMVYKHLKQNSAFEVQGTSRNPEEENILFSAEKDIDEQLAATNPDYIINCIGIIKPLCKDDNQEGVIKAIKTNALFPHRLNEYATRKGIKVIQIATDCVYSGTKGNYDEDAQHDALDVYGKTKSLGEPFTGNVLNIRCSIIGPEIGAQKRSLMEWFLNHKQGSTLQGYNHHKWNGVTTLEFARLVEQIILQEKFDDLHSKRPTVHFVPPEIVTKYELLCLFKEVFNKDYEIKKVDNVGPAIDRTLSTKEELFGFFDKKTIRESLVELKKIMKKYY